jgi:hypothetical protein
MDVFSTELGIRHSFSKISEFRGSGLTPRGTPHCMTMCEINTKYLLCV